VNFHEKAIEDGSDCGAGEDGSEFAILVGGTTKSAGALHGMGLASKIPEVSAQQNRSCRDGRD
jgi:hypothetical protein